MRYKVQKFQNKYYQKIAKFPLLILLSSCSLEKEKKAIDKENVEFEYMVAMIQEVCQRLEKDNVRLENFQEKADEKIKETVDMGKTVQRD